MKYSLMKVVIALLSVLLVAGQQNDLFENTQTFVDQPLAASDDSCKPYHPKELTCSYEYLETFQESKENQSKWIYSYDRMYANQHWNDMYGDVKPTIECDKSLVAMDRVQRFGIANKLDKVIDNKGKDLVIQYEARFQHNITCSGGYIKLIRAGELDGPEYLKEDSVYSLMFGPDYCGEDNNKIKLIIQHYNQETKKWTEYRVRNTPKTKLDDKTHLYTLIIYKNGSFEILVDDHVTYGGNVQNDFYPSFNPPKEIEDPNDTKPVDWDDHPFIYDMSVKKPDDWDETQPEYILDETAVKPETWLDDAPLKIPDPQAHQPEDWDEELDGEYIPPLIDNPACEQFGCGVWERPRIKNPLYKGPWHYPKIANPHYQGVWSPRMIPNPDYYIYENPQEIEPFDTIAFDIWSMDGGVAFDNILITHDPACAKAFAAETFRVKTKLENPEVEKVPKKKMTIRKANQMTFSQYVNKLIDETWSLEYDEQREQYVIMVMNVIYVLMAVIGVVNVIKKIVKGVKTSSVQPTIHVQDIHHKDE